MRYIYTFFCLLSFTGISQVSIPDTLNIYTSKYEAGLITLSELDSSLAAFFGGLPEDREITRYEKEYNRGMAFWKDRTMYDGSGNELPGAYTKALIDYLGGVGCPQDDKGHWKFSFDPAPISDYVGVGVDTTLGLCTEPGDHAAGIIFSIYMNPADNDIIIAGAGTSGLWRSSDGGANWTNVTDHLEMPALGIREIIDISKPSQPVGSVLLAVTGRGTFHDSYGIGVLRSDDYGETWTRHDMPLDAGIAPFIIEVTKPHSESDLVFACSKEKVYYSPDFGFNWLEMASVPTRVDKEVFYGLSSSGGTEDMLYLSTYSPLGEANIYRTPTSSISWESRTEQSKTAVEGCNFISVEETYDFEDGFDGLDSNSYYDSEDDIFYEFYYEDVLGDQYLAAPSLTIPGDSWFPVGGLHIIHDLGVLPMGSDIFISCNADIPDGGIIEFYVVDSDVADFVDPDDELDLTGVWEIGSFTSDGTGVMAYSETFSIPDAGFMSHLVVRFNFTSPYPYGGTTPILFDDFHFEIDVDGKEIAPKGFGIAMSDGDEIYTAVQAIDSITGKNKIFILNSVNKGATWTCTGVGSGTNTHGSGDVLPFTDNFTAGYGTQEGFYLGGVRFIRYDTDLEDYYEVCSQHDDVRDIQIVKNLIGDNHIVVGDDGGVAYSPDGGFTWNSLNGSGLPVTQFYSIAVNPHDNITVIGGTQDNGTFLGSTVDGWSIVGGGDGGGSGFSPDPARAGEYFYNVNARTYLIEEDMGDLDTLYHYSSAYAYLGRPLEISPNSGNYLFEGYNGKDGTAYENAVIARHDFDPTGGFDPVPLLVGFPEGTSEIGEIEVCPDNENVIYAAEGENLYFWENKLFVSTDNGVSFTDITLLPTGNILTESDTDSGKELRHVLKDKNANAIESDPNDYNHFWIGISGIHTDDSDNVVGGKFRVLETDDGGNTWHDYSNGLPPFPINDLVYQVGTNDRLFAATDVGVFYRENGMDEWVCFQKGMPAVFATDLEINYCSQSLYAGTYGRGIWKSIIDLPDSQPVIIDSDLTISGLADYEHDVIVETGNTLTITGLVNMAGAKKIKVQQGAQLIIDGGTITNNCDAFWGGIEVWGDKDEIQIPTSNQGKVVLKNGATIEHASVAITTWKKGDYNSTGGLIFASSSAFKNNKKDVEFRAYQNYNGAGVPIGNKSYFSGVTFTWDDDFRAEFPLGHVTMYKVDGIKFSGCTFEDDRTAPPSAYHDNGYSPRNSGIYSIDAQYYVTSICTDMGGCSGALSDDPDWSPTTFKNLDFGIYASTATTERNITVDRSQFENNLYGVELINVNSPIVTRNEFIVNDDPTNNFLDHAEYGIHAVRSKGLKIEENKFTHLTGDNAVYGIVCSDLGESDEEIYNNYFESLKYGITTQGKNRNYTGFDGLKFYCDSNVNNQKDHLILGTLWGIEEVVDVGEVPTYGVKRLSGAGDNPSGNIFTAAAVELTGEHYDNLSDNEVFYYHRQFDIPETPTDYLGLFTPLAIDFENNCPSKLEDNGLQEYANTTRQDFKTDFGMVADDLETKEATYQSLVNGGNTDSLMTEIDNLIVANREQLRSLLNSYSPYLTREVVEATVNNPITKYPHAWAYELIVDNIEVAYEDGFIEFLSSKEHPMPQWLIDDIQAELDSGLTTDMLVKQTELADLRSQKAYLANVIVQSYKNDTVSTDMDSIRHWIEQQDNILTDTRIIDAYIQDGNLTVAQSELNALNTNIQNYPAYLQDELTDYVSLKNKVIEILNAGSDLDSLSESDHTLIANIANSGEGIARYQARELLCFFYDECVEYPVVTNQAAGALMPFFEKEKDRQDERNFTVYPNPANNWVTIVLPESYVDLTVTVVDLTGRIVFNQITSRSLFNWDTETIGDGTYLITITDQLNLESYGTQKVTIQH